MWEQGQKTKRTYFWMADADISDFSQALAEAIPELHWQCYGGKPTFPTLDQTLSHNRADAVVAQAFAPLALSALQFITHAPRVKSNIIDHYAPNYVYPATFTSVDYGSLAVRWNSQDGDEATQALMLVQLKAIWKVFGRYTLPAKIHATSGRPINGWRIGPRMRAEAQEKGWFLKSNGPYCLLKP
jgi:hypothetical protein